MSLLIVKGIATHSAQHMMGALIDMYHVQLPHGTLFVATPDHLQLNATITVCIHEAHLVQTFEVNACLGILLSVIYN